jgi:tetratricopeptide (TPR) repeat protein
MTLACGRPVDDRFGAWTRARGHTAASHEAAAHFGVAAGYFRQVGDDHGEALVHVGRTWVAEARGDYATGLRHALAAIELDEAAGRTAGLACAHNSAGWFHAQLGQYKAAIAICRRALALHIATGNSLGEAHTRHSIGFVHLRLRAYDEAIACYDKAPALAHIHRPRSGARCARAAWARHPAGPSRHPAEFGRVSRVVGGRDCVVPGARMSRQWC